jgi:hypothetical protein
MLVSMEPGADFSRGYAGGTISHSILKTRHAASQFADWLLHVLVVVTVNGTENILSVPFRRSAR